MEGAVGNRPVAKERHADLGDAQEFKGVAGTGGLEDAGTDDAAGAHHPHLRREKVHGTAAPLRAARGFAEKFGDQLLGWDAFGEGVTVAAMGAKDRVVVVEVGANAGGDSFLANVRVAGTGDQTGLVGPGELLFAAADDQHLAIERQTGILVGQNCFS